MFVVLYKPKWALLNAKVCRERRFKRGSCGGQVVSVLAFYSDDPCSNPADAYSFFCQIFV